VPRGVLVAAGTVLVQRKIDHRPQHQHGRQLVLASQRLRCRGQDFIPIAVQFACVPAPEPPRGSDPARR
jgi:hypothetical protein